MKEYEFGLRFSLPPDETHSDELIERLGDAGCDDALVGIGHPGRIAFEFAREADSAYGAILSAIQDVKRVLPGAEGRGNEHRGSQSAVGEAVSAS